MATSRTRILCPTLSMRSARGFASSLRDLHGSQRHLKRGKLAGSPGLLFEQRIGLCFFFRLEPQVRHIQLHVAWIRGVGETRLHFDRAVAD
jgi:hypothetical protein